MSINEEYFYQGTEGFLGKEKDCKVLFLMREPNSGGKIVRDGVFWFKKVVDNDKDKEEIGGECYLSKLGQIASLLLDNNCATNNEQRISALKHAVYINMNPVCGSGTVSKYYKKAIKQFKKEYPICNVCDMSFSSRWNIIFGMPDQSTIVTVSDIYNVMYNVLGKNPEINIDNNSPKLIIQHKHEQTKMRSFAFEYKGKRINVLSCIHPAAYAKYYYTADNISLDRGV